MKKGLGAIERSICNAMISKQTKQGFLVDANLLAGRAPKWAISRLWVLTTLFLLPFAILLLMQTLPSQWVIDLGYLARRIWPRVDDFTLLFCRTECPKLVFGMIVIPVAYAAGILGAIWWFINEQNRLEYQRALRLRQPQRAMAATLMNEAVPGLEMKPVATALFIISVASMCWYSARSVGVMHHDLSGRPEVLTGWIFASWIAILEFGIAGLGSVAARVHAIRVSRG